MSRKAREPKTATKPAKLRRTQGTFEARPVPFSQDESKITRASKEDVTTELWRIVKLHPEMVISRNFFRVHSRYAESAWSEHAGTWQEFKRQAGVTLSRHAHRLERDIAKHASVDIQRQTNVEKQEWAEAYLRPSSRRFQTVLHLCDVHDQHCDPFYLRVVMDTAQRVQPEKIILNGDIFDLPEFSKHFQDPREFHLIKRIAWVHAFLAGLRGACPNAEIAFIEGNHEYRLLRHMSEQSPAMMVVLADLHDFTVPKLLGLEQFEVNFIARADLTAFNERDIAAQLRKNYVVCWDALLFGHFPQMRSMGYPGASGHHHRHIVWSEYSPTFGPYEWHQSGCGHRREASYASGERWGNGFLLVHCDTHTKRSQFEYFDLSHPHAFVGGRFYERSSNETVLDLQH